MLILFPLSSYSFFFNGMSPERSPDCQDLALYLITWRSAPHPRAGGGEARSCGHRPGSSRDAQAEKQAARAWGRGDMGSRGPLCLHLHKAGEASVRLGVAAVGEVAGRPAGLPRGTQEVPSILNNLSPHRSTYFLLPMYLMRI